MNEKIEEVKEHLRRNKEKYFIGAAGIVVGATGTMLIVGRGSGISQRIVGLIVWKPEQTIISLVDPGDIILVKETGEKIRSKNAAARALGINRHELYNLGQGETRKIGRWTVTNIGQAETA